MKSHEHLLASQEALVEAIFGHADHPSFNRKGLAVYQQSLSANAKRALAISYPTILRLIGEDSFALLTIDFLRDHPLIQGDWGAWGKEFPRWIKLNNELRGYPYISDCAQLDWAYHNCERAQDTHMNVASLQLLSNYDAYGLKLRCSYGVSVVQSRYPIVDIWNAHHLSDNDQQTSKNLFVKAAQSIEQGVAQTAVIWRPQWKAKVRVVDELEQRWLQLILGGNSLGNALDQMQGILFSFETWLPQAINDHIVCGIDRITNSSIKE